MLVELRFIVTEREARLAASARRVLAEQARTEIGAATLDVVADRGYYDSQEILACETVGITVTLPKPMTSSAMAAGRFGKQDFVYVAADDVYRCPAGEMLTYRYTNEEDGKTLRRYWTSACQKGKSRIDLADRSGVDVPDLQPEGTGSFRRQIAQINSTWYESSVPRRIRLLTHVRQTSLS